MLPARRSPLFQSALLLCCAIASPLGAQTPAGGAPSSAITLPIRIPVQLLRPALDAAFPIETDRESVWAEGRPLADGSRLRYQIYLFRGPVRIEVVAGALALRLDEIQYRLRAEITHPSGEVVRGTCGYGEQWPRRVRLAGRSEVAWTENWTFATRTRFEPPELLDPCRLSDGTDLTPALDSGLARSLDDVARAIDEGIAESGAARRRFEALWQALAQPFELSPGTWLQLGPRDAVAGAIGGSGATIETAIGLTLAPEVTLAPPVSGAGAPVPALRLATLPEPRVDFELPFVTSFEEIDARLAQQLVGTELQVMGRSGLRIDSARASHRGGAIAVEMGVSGAIDGIAVVVGRAELEAGGRGLVLRELEASVETRGRLAGAMSGIAEKALTEAVASQGRIDLGPRLDALRDGLNRALNREVASGIWLQGEVTALRLGEIGADDEGIEARFLFDAPVRVELR